MAWTDWVPITSSTYMKIDFMSQVYENEQWVGGLIDLYMRYYPNLYVISTSDGFEQQPLFSYINLAERNIDKLSSCSPAWETTIEPTRTWLGENADIPSFNYDDVNRWFRSLLTMKLMLDTIPVRYRISGTFFSGTNGAVQRVRRA